MKINQVLIKPVLTEKATNLTKDKFYSFEVNKKANKFQIKSTIEKYYKVKVDNIKVIVRKGKIKKIGKRNTPKKLPDIKIAYIKLKEGKIDLFPQT